MPNTCGVLRTTASTPYVIKPSNQPQGERNEFELEKKEHSHL